MDRRDRVHHGYTCSFSRLKGVLELFLFSDSTGVYNYCQKILTRHELELLLYRMSTKYEIKRYGVQKVLLERIERDDRIVISLCVSVDLYVGPLF